MIELAGNPAHELGLLPARLVEILIQDPLDIIGQDGRTAYGKSQFALGDTAPPGFASRARFYLDDELIADPEKNIRENCNSPQDR